MQRIVPVKNTVLCRKNEIPSKKTGNILYKPEVVDEYTIVDFSSDGFFPFSIGDTVIVEKTGDEVDCNGETFYIFKTEHVVAKVLN